MFAAIVAYAFGLYIIGWAGFTEVYRPDERVAVRPGAGRIRLLSLRLPAIIATTAAGTALSVRPGSPNWLIWPITAGLVIVGAAPYEWDRLRAWTGRRSAVREP